VPRVRGTLSNHRLSSADWAIGSPTTMPPTPSPSNASPDTLSLREAEFFDEAWKSVPMRHEPRPLQLAALGDLAGKRVLVCSCGTGIEPVRVARSGAETFACDISITAVENARRMAEFNGVQIAAEVSDIHALGYPDNFFDVLYGTSFLHHIDIARAAPEMYRVLRPGGIAYFRENWDGNPLLRWLRRRLFGKPGDIARSRWAFVKRTGSSDEYPLTPDEFRVFAAAFSGHAHVTHDRFLFFYLLNFLVLRNARAGQWLRQLDRAVGRAFPSLMRYSFSAVITGRKPIVGDIR
jgi:ubiquinone/menaquinone biosynthesis C-methylase UbiE